MTTIYDILDNLNKNIDKNLVIVANTRCIIHLPDINYIPTDTTDRLIINTYLQSLTYLYNGMVIWVFDIKENTIRYVYDFNDYWSRTHNIDIEEDELFQLSLIEKNVIGVTEIGIVKKALEYANSKLNGE
ncbi:hypothetical protein N0S44_000198 [Escherichia coli]|nr:hypothetical protein [Escherichia coli]EJR1979048.1 hypothetical protein [Escherichia coli]